ncbi:MAG: imidazolonepropionase [bacterium]|nr:imidazolonepropionase [bacterium]
MKHAHDSHDARDGRRAHDGPLLHLLPGAGDEGGPDLLMTGIGQLCTLHVPELEAAGPRRGTGLGALGLVDGAALAVRNGRVLATGPQSEVLAALAQAAPVGPRTRVVDAGGRAVIPGFVDPHTHAVFGRWRQDEYERRVRGETYLEIAAAGGGINASVRDLRGRDEDELCALAASRLGEMLSWGTTTVEIKSGYGLSPDDEAKMLRAARRAAREAGLDAVLTCLAAHEVPPEYRDRRDQYVQLIVDTILPRVAREGLADRCDVFCEPTVFDLAQSETILRRAAELGLQLTVHADELEPFGGAALAARLGAASADHLIRIDEAGRAALAASSTVAVLLPGTVFTLGLKAYAPARAMVDDGCAVALATDFNPGSCPILAMPLILAIACTQMRLTPAEALTAATLNAAWALGRQDVCGSLAPGKRADFVLLDGPDFRLVPYRAGHNPVAGVFVGGQEIILNPGP